MKKVIILALITLNFGAYAQKSDFRGKEVLKAAQNEQFISVAYSGHSHFLFTSTTSGKMIALNDSDSIVKTFSFKNKGTIQLDMDGAFGAYSDDQYRVHIFGQKSLTVVDSFRIPASTGDGAMKVWFTQNGKFISTFKNVYQKTGSKIVKVASSFSILDYDYSTDKFLLGQWDESMTSDRKVKKLFIATSKNITDMTHVLTTSRSFEVYSYLMDNATNVVSYDGRENYYNHNMKSNKTTTTIQDTIENPKKKFFSLAKIDEETLMMVKHGVIAPTPENIQKYEMKLGDKPTEFVFKNSSNNDTTRWIIMFSPVVNNQIVVNNTNDNIYYLSSGGNGNKLISISK